MKSSISSKAPSKTKGPTTGTAGKKIAGPKGAAKKTSVTTGKKSTTKTDSKPKVQEEVKIEE